MIKSKQNDEESFVVAATNAISVLNAANFSFSGKDLSKIKITVIKIQIAMIFPYK